MDPRWSGTRHWELPLLAFLALSLTGSAIFIEAGMVVGPSLLEHNSRMLDAFPQVALAFDRLLLDTVERRQCALLHYLRAE